MTRSGSDRSRRLIPKLGVVSYPPPHRSETKKSEADAAAGRGFGDGGGDKLNRIYSLGPEPINTPWMACGSLGSRKRPTRLKGF